MIYLDFAASTPMVAEAQAVLTVTSKVDFANPSSAHKLGKNLMKRLDEVRADFLQSVNADKEYQFYFTSSATESNNLVIQGLTLPAEADYFCSQADHPSVTAPMGFVARETLNKIEHNSSGQVDRETLLNQVCGKSGIVVLSHINNISGIRTPIKELSAQIKEIAPKMHIHIDGAQAFSKFPLSLLESGIDSYAVSGHKMGGPKGVGGLFLRKGIALRPMILGGGHEQGLRASTLNAPALLAWNEAMEAGFRNQERHFQSVSELKNKLVSELQDMDEVEAPFSRSESSPYILGLLVKGVSSDIVLRHLEMSDIYISSSSACSSRKKGDSPVLAALNVPKQRHKEYLRISFGSTSSEEELEKFLSVFKQTVAELRQLGGRK